MTIHPACSFEEETISAQVADAIRQKMLSGEYGENLRLRQEHIATSFGVSRIPVREALHRLHSVGLVTSISHKGAVVTPVSLEEILELYELRARIETWLLSLAIPRITGEHFALAAVEAERFGQQSDETEYSHVLNCNFHKALHVASGRRATVEIVGRIHQQIERYTRMMVSLTGVQRQSDAEHRELVGLCRSGDLAGATRLLDHQIMRGGRHLVERLTAMRDAGPLRPDDIATSR